MSNIALIGASCEAIGHPTECEEPVTGSIVSDSSTSLTINGTSVATTTTSTISFSSHSHDYSSQDGCHQNSSHSLDADTTASSVTLNGDGLYLVKDGVTTDPITDGDVNIVTNSTTNSVTKT